jgi:hypothetical protein
MQFQATLGHIPSHCIDANQSGSEETVKTLWSCAYLIYSAS